MTYHYMFPEEILALQEELQSHPLLMKQLRDAEDQSLESRLGIIAAFCGIVLDGYYNEEEVLQLCDKMVHELKRAKAELIQDISAPITH